MKFEGCYRLCGILFCSYNFSRALRGHKPHGTHKKLRIALDSCTRILYLCMVFLFLLGLCLIHNDSSYRLQ